MKRVVCLLVIVSIAYAGCADKKQNKVTVVPLHNGWYTPGDWKSNAVLMQENVRLRDELYKVKTMHKPNKALLVKIDDLETALKSRGVVESIDKALLVRIAKLEAVIESQSAMIKSSKNVHRLHEVALEYQRVALDSLLNLCRLYEAKIESQRVEMELFL